MKKVLIIIVILIVLGALWWLGKPLLVDQEINEEFPVVEDTHPTLEEVEQMTDEEKALIQDEMMEEAAEMPPVVVEESMPEESEPILLAEGVFTDADAFHKGSGHAGIYQLQDGSRVLRLEDFSVTNGPDLRILLATGENPTNTDSLGDYIEIEKLKGNQGNQNYDIADDLDLSLYNSVVIYCKPFHVVFSVASLQ